MDNLSVIPIILTVITAATPLVFAALGELVVEKSGVLNLGVEGLMLIGAVAGFATATLTGSATIGVFAAIIAGAALSMIFAVIVLQLRANQVATGLALTLFGTGLAALIGQGYVGFPVEPLPRIAIPLLADIPVVGPILFHQLGWAAAVQCGHQLREAADHVFEVAVSGLICRIDAGTAHCIARQHQVVAVGLQRDRGLWLAQSEARAAKIQIFDDALIEL